MNFPKLFGKGLISNNSRIWHNFVHNTTLITVCQQSCGKVMFSVVCVYYSVHGRVPMWLLSMVSWVSHRSCPQPQPHSQSSSPYRVPSSTLPLTIQSFPWPCTLTMQGYTLSPVPLTIRGPLALVLVLSLDPKIDIFKLVQLRPHHRTYLNLFTM